MSFDPNETINDEIGGDWKNVGVSGKANPNNAAPNASYHAEAGTNKYAARAGAGADANLFEAEDDLTSVKAFGVGANVNAEAGLGGIGAGVEAGAHLIEAEAVGIGVKLGVGVNTGAYLGPGGGEIKVAGTGISIGKKTGVSVLGNEFYIDFGTMGKKFKWW